jgi:hypothetical protein
VKIAKKRSNVPLGLILSAILAGFLGLLWILPSLLPGASAVAKLEALGARVQRRPYFPQLAECLDGPVFPYGDVWLVQLQGANISVDDMRLLQDFPRLEELLITKARFDPGALEPLARLTKLRMLFLADSSIPASDFAAIGRIPSIEDLCLWGTNVGDEDLAFVEHLSSLRVLDLDSTRVTDRALAHLKESYALLRLDISNTTITDRAVRELQQSLRYAASRLFGPDQFIRIQQLEVSRKRLSPGSPLPPVLPPH